MTFQSPSINTLCEIRSKERLRGEGERGTFDRGNLPQQHCILVVGLLERESERARERERERKGEREKEELGSSIHGSRGGVLIVLFSHPAYPP